MLRRLLTALLGVVTTVPLLYLVGFVVYLRPKVASFRTPGGMDPAQFSKLFDFLFPIHAIAVALTVTLVVSYSVLVSRAPSVPANRKPLWMALLVFGNVLAMPVFWYLHIWRKAGESLPVT